jgi:hypothetical protein
MEPSRQPASHTFDTLQIVFTGLGVLGLWALAAGFLILGMISRIGGELAGSSNDLMGIACVFASFLAAGFSLIPGVILPIFSIRGKTILPPLQRWEWIVGVFAISWPLFLLLGRKLLTLDTVGLFTFPLVHVAVVLIPVLVLLWIVIHRMRFQSPQRAAGLSTTGMLAGTLLSFSLEAFVILGLGLVLLVILLLNPGWILELTHLSSRLSIAANDAKALQEILFPYLARPGVLAVVVSITSGFIPLIEELCKPVGFWILFKREWTVRDGFVGGAFSGAGFALIESLLAIAQSLGTSWAAVATIRIGAAAMHIFASSLVGMALVYGWKEKRYLKMVLLYFGAVAIHGLWNLFAITVSFGQLTNLSSPFLTSVGNLSPFLLGILALVALTGLVALNRHFRGQNESRIRIDAA